MAYSKLPHIVRKQIFEVHLSERNREREITEQLLDAYHFAMPSVEAVLNAYDDPDRIIQIDRIFLDLGNLELNKFEEVFSARLRDVLSGMLFPKAQLLEKSRNEFRKSFVKRMDYATSTRNTPIEIPNNFENQSVVDSCTVMEGLSRALFYFLKNGVFPWWLSDKHDVRLHVIFSPVL